MENTQEEEKNVPKWMNFLCPSCGIGYGISAIIKTIKNEKHDVVLLWVAEMI